jgi:hypothetical protein
MKKLLLQSSMISVAVVLTSLRAIAAPSSLAVSDWSKDLQAAVTGQKSAQILKLTDLTSLENALFKKQDPESDAALTAGRKQYAAGNLDQAIASYNQVRRGSDLWLESLDEKGWSYFRQGQMNKALAQAKTLLGDTFLPVVGTDAFFLQSLANLKICDYKAVLATHRLFKATQKDRLAQIQELAEKGQTPVLANVIAKAEQFPLEFKNLGQESKSLPLHFYRDIAFQKALLNMKLAEAGLPILQAAGKTAATTAAISRLEKVQKGALEAANKRLATLARAENDANYKILQKLNLIEVEAIERMHADLQNDKNKYSHGEFAKTTSDDLVFPDEGDLWIDELDNYQVRVNSCPQNIRRQM